MKARALVGLLVFGLAAAACEDVDRWATPTRVAADVVVATSHDFTRINPDDAAGPSAVAAAVARREGPGGSITIVMDEPIQPMAAETAVAVALERRGVTTPGRAPAARSTPEVSRRVAATATARAALDRVVRAGPAEPPRQTVGEADPGLSVGAAEEPLDAAALLRQVNGLSPDDTRCDDLALAARAAPAREAGFAVAPTAETDLLLERLRSGCGLEGVQLTPELAAAIAALPPPAMGGVSPGAGAPIGGTTRRDADRAGTTSGRRTDDGTSGGLDAPPRRTDRRPRFTSPATVGRPPVFDNIGTAVGTRP